jgi:CheY-like chemotaxis protein
MQSLVNITELIENTLELRAYALKTANIKVVREYAPELPWITVDPGQIQQVFLNLIVNAEFAMKKAHDRGILTITTGQTEEHIRILVSDTGPGLTDEAKAKLFQPFFTTKNPGEGAGLGLPLSRGIIHEHGGTIKIDELAGDGTTFIIELPLSRDDTAAAPRQAAGGRPAEPLENARVLVVDDEQMVRSFIKQILTESGHIVEECDNGFQALEKLEEFAAYDVILMDVRMPGLSGIELHYEIANRWPDLAARITFITGDISDSATRDYLANHKLAFITKPFTRASLADKLSMKTTSEASE